MNEYRFFNFLFFGIKSNVFFLSLILFGVSGYVVAESKETIFEDDFRGVMLMMPNGAEKRYPDPAKWAFTFLPGIKWPKSYGNGTNWLENNGECQTYVTPFLDEIRGKEIPASIRYDPFTIKEDGLHITADLLTAEQQHAYHVGGARRFGSGILLSRFAFTYGKITLVAKLPSAQGSWPAFWLLPQRFVWPPEIDVFEGMAWGSHSQEIHSGYIEKKKKGYGEWFSIDSDPSREFHEYSLDWTRESLKVFLDGDLLWEKPTPDGMHEDMYLLINLAVGGKWPFNELGIKPIDGRDHKRMTKGADMIENDYPAEMILRSLKVMQSM